jgi:hypothetical protein
MAMNFLSESAKLEQNYEELRCLTHNLLMIYQVKSMT